jgi:excisionase family DNA binding protein
VPPEELWTAKDLSRAFKTAISTIYQWVHEGRIPHVKLGTCVRFRPQEVQVWLEQQCQPGRLTRVPEEMQP